MHPAKYGFLGAIAVTCIAGLPTASSAQSEGTYKATEPTVACVNPRAALALSNKADPRQADPRWVNYVMTDGRCVRITPDAVWTVGTRSGSLALMQPEGGGTPLYVAMRELAAVSGADGTGPLSPPLPDSASFHEGQSDRVSWDAWFNGLSGDRKPGANFWASHRSLKNPGNCFGTSGQDLGDFTSGCEEAKKRLSTIDGRRKSEPDYRLGFNNAPAVPALTTAINVAPTKPVAAPAGPPDEEKIAVERQVAAENSPDNLCRQPEMAKHIMEGFSDFKLVKQFDAKVLDIEHLTTLKSDKDKGELACHGTFVLDNGIRLTGVYEIRPNVAGDLIASWKLDR